MRFAVVLLVLGSLFGCTSSPQGLPSEYHQNGSLYQEPFEVKEHFSRSSTEIWLLFIPLKTASTYGTLVNDAIVERSADGAVNVENYATWCWLGPPLVWFSWREVEGDLVKFE